jgi:hypothetical protein
VSRPITVGFGNGTISAMARTQAGALLCRDGQTTTLADAEIDAGEADSSWHARAADNTFEAAFEPLGPPAVFADGAQEWLCRVSGQVDGELIECLGHVVLGDDGPPPDWRKTALVRGVSAWFDGGDVTERSDLAFAVHARRPAKVDAHGGEALEAIVLRGTPPEPVAIEDPRLSTAYADGGRQQRAGLELWETEESDYALRLAAETIGAGQLTLPDGAVLRSAFLRWRYDGRLGTGRYDITLPPSR